VVQFPVETKKLLTKRRVAEEFRAHLDVLHQAGRTLLGSSAHFSTRRGQAAAHLQVGVGLQRTGLEFGEVEQGTPVHLTRTGREPTPLGIGRLDDPEHRAAAREYLESLAARPSWREETRPPQPAQELIGTPASPEVEGARLLLWGLFNPMLLRDRGFDLAAPRPSARKDSERLAARPSWREETRPPQPAKGLTGPPASPEVEGARLLLWGLFNPMLLRDRGFDLAAARRQPALTTTTLGLRLH